MGVVSVSFVVLFDVVMCIFCMCNNGQKETVNDDATSDAGISASLVSIVSELSIDAYL